MAHECVEFELLTEGDTYLPVMISMRIYADPDFLRSRCGHFLLCPRLQVDASGGDHLPDGGVHVC